MMKDTRSIDRRTFVRTVVTLVLVLCLCLAVLPSAPASASAQDDAMKKLIGWGVMSGYPDGSLQPNRSITRAEFVALVNRAYGYRETGVIPFRDVSSTAWYYDDVSIAYNAGYFDGTSATTASPGANLTREQAMTLLARSMRLDSIPGEITDFSDGRSFSSWSRGFVMAAYRKGLVSGYSDGSFRPTRNITRGEMSILLSRALGNLVHEEGEHTLGSVNGNVTINTPNVTLYDTTIVGDLYITGGLGLGSVVLDNVRVLGSIIVAGGGESEAGEDSVILRNVRADELKIDSLAGQYLSIRAEGETVITQTNVRTDSYIQDRTQAGQGLLNITLEGANGNYTLAGNLESVVNKAAGSSLKISRGTLTSLTIDETALNSKLEIYNDATVKELNLDTAVNVTGSGDVGSLNVNAAGSSTSMLPDDIHIRPGITANVYEETMDTTLGEESSSAPRILAGYPKASDVGPTTLTATVSTNKSGTLYWAVSAITDGSVGEEELISPPSYGSKAVKYGTLQVGQSNTDLTVNVTGLTVGGYYYFSAVLVDARNDRSPVKIVSFGTPDNTVPNFASGYPALTENWYYTEEEFEELYPELKYSPETKYYAQFFVKSTKTTRLYWAVYTKGSTAPTAAEFRSQSLAGSVAHGVREAERNADADIKVTDLHELTDYDIYFWLCDADGTKSSAVKKVTFKTVDGTRPQFNITPQHSANPKANTITMTTNVNEAATVYWVAVLSGTAYPAERPDTITMTDEQYYILQVVNGINALKSGKVSVKANTDATFTISGLTAETAYDIWYVAMDTAGNYSLFYTKADVAKDTSLTASYVTEHTLDSTAPTVTLEFSKHDDTGRPYPDTDIILTFSEDVMALPISTHGSASLWELWELAQEDDETAKANLKTFLEETIYLMCFTPDNEVERVGEKVLDYKKVEITRASDGKGVVVRFKDAVLDSGTTYRFDLYDLADTSLANNTMAPPNPYTSEDLTFITVSSKIILTNLDNLVQTTISTGDIITDDTKYKDQIKKPIDPVLIDAAFSLKPEATSREDPAKEWDMLIWCDTSVTFELYRRYTPSTTNSSGSGDDSGSNSDDENKNDRVTMAGKAEKWEKLPGTWTTGGVRTGTGTITISSTELGHLVGLSLFESFDDFKASSTSQRTNHYLRNLDEGATYEYAIHITNLDNTPETKRDSWSKDVTFQINIVAGTGLYSKLTNATITETRYDKAINGDYQEVDDISNALKQRLPFQLYLHYEDKEPPTFATVDYPFFDRSDTSIKMTVQLNRKGTVYWYAAPVGSLLDAYSGNLALQPTTAAVPADPEDFKLPTTIDDDLIRPAVNADRHLLPDAVTHGKLSEPTIDRIYSPTDTHERVRFGSAPADRLAEITIPDLDPSTLYYIYIVLRGEAMTSYSTQAELFLVATTTPDSPILRLSNNLGDPNMGIATTDRDSNVMPSTVNYVIIPDEAEAIRNANAGLDSPMSAVLDDSIISVDDFKEKFADIYKDYANDDDFTVLKAMQENVFNQNIIIGTVFDLYASQDAKDKVMNFITGGASGSSVIVGGSSVTITERIPTVTVNCSQHPLNTGTNYLFLAVAVDPQTRERGFNVSPLLVTDSAAPALDDLLYSGLEVYKDESGNYTLGGTITLMFDKNLYWLSSNNERQDIYASDAERTNSVKIDTIADDLTKLSFVKDNTVVERTIKLQLADGCKSASAVFKTNICNASKIPDSKNRKLEIKLESEKGVWYVDITYSDWDTNFHARFAAENRATPITLNTESQTVPVGSTYTLQATTEQPTTFTWKSSNTSVATVDANGKVTAKAAGKATITVTTPDGGEATCEITVVPKKLTVSLSTTSVSLALGDTWTLTAASDPDGATFSWASSDTTVAEVSSSGVVTAKGGGTARITVTAKLDNDTATATCTVTVLAPSVSLDSAANVSRSGGGTTLKLKLTNLDESMIKTVNWFFSPSNQTVFTIDKDGGTSVSVRWNGGGSVGSNVNIYAKVTTTGGATYTTQNCKLTLTQ